MADYREGAYEYRRRGINIYRQSPRVDAPRRGTLVTMPPGQYVVWEIQDVPGAPDLVRAFMIPVDPPGPGPVTMLGTDPEPPISFKDFPHRN